MFGHQDDNKDEEDNGVISPPQDNNGAVLDNTISDDSVGGDNDNDQIQNTNPDEGTNDQPLGLPVVDNGLLEIKKQALAELSPLVGHLDQTPEEKFKTTMMMIQANDNQSLIPDAYHSAKQITDDKTRARALLDIVNEINYFTHHTEK